MLSEGLQRLVDLKALERRNNELERFTYTVSLDLRSPLISIHGFVGLLEKDLNSGNNEFVIADLTRINHVASTMEELLSDLLELSRVCRAVGPIEEVVLADWCQSPWNCCPRGSRRPAPTFASTWNPFRS